MVLPAWPWQDPTAWWIDQIQSDSKQGSDVVAQIQAMKLNPKKTDEKKKRGLRGFVVGSVMRQLSGRVPASKVEAAVDDALNKI